MLVPLFKWLEDTFVVKRKYFVMEPEALDFLKRVAKSILLALVWLAINAVAAIWGDNAFVDGHLKLSNIFFYTWFVFSVVLLVYMLKKMWQQQEEF